MKQNISSRDWTTLSAYLDGQLSSKDKARLESRLKDNSDLQQALEDLRRTRRILRSQPRLRAPRNFTLTPAMAGMRQRSQPAPRAYPFLRLASAFAGFLLALVLIGDFATTSIRMANPASAPAPVAMSAERQAAPTAAVAGVGVEASPEPANALPALPQATPQQPEPTSSPPEATPAPLLKEFSMAQPTATLEGAVQPPQVMAPAQEQTEAPAAQDTENATQSQASPAGTTPSVLGAPAVPETLEPQPTATATIAPTDQAQTAQPATIGQFSWRLAEIALAMIAIAAGLAAWLVRRSSL